MAYSLGKRIERREMTRRDFLWLMSISAAGVMIGCASNPVTGKKQFMLVTEDRELDIDRSNSPHQFSADYGAVLDGDLNNYLTRTGTAMASRSHRPQMPYSFRVVNATYVNAYAFPGGSIAATRGILLSLNNEAELAGLLGHEIGHVNARHAAERMSKGILISAVVAGATAYAQVEHERYAPLAAGLGGIGAGMLLAGYSRDDEREADALGMEYMVKANHSPKGMVGLMEVLRSMSRRKPGAIEMMFATHPMSEERYQTATQTVQTKHKAAGNFPLNRDRYMDHTAKLRSMEGAIEEMQNGEVAMMKKQFQNAESHFQSALKKAPNDYAALVMMGKCQLALKRPARARQYVDRAKLIHPKEAQAYHLSGMARMMGRRFGSAYEEFNNYEKLLPGNPNTIFLKAVSLDGMQRRDSAAREYTRYLRTVNQGEQAQHAYRRLVGWGYIKPKK